MTASAIFIFVVTGIVLYAGGHALRRARRRHEYRKTEAVIRCQLAQCTIDKRPADDWGFVINEWVNLRRRFGYPDNLTDQQRTFWMQWREPKK